MRINVIAAVAGWSLAFAGPVFADDVACAAAKDRPAVMSMEKAIEKAETFGYSVYKSKSSKGCWKIEGIDRNGAEIEIRFDPGTGDVVRSGQQPLVAVPAPASAR